MLGANVVHMTLLQQLLAEALKRECGPYRVMSNNLHVYKSTPRFESIWETTLTHDPYRDFVHPTHSLLTGDELFEEFLWDARDLVYKGAGKRLRTKWFQNVAVPMYLEYRLRKADIERVDKGHIDEIKDDAWAQACRLWEEWHE
jgi:hypothetical protein